MRKGYIVAIVGLVLLLLSGLEEANAITAARSLDAAYEQNCVFPVSYLPQCQQLRDSAASAWDLASAMEFIVFIGVVLIVVGMVASGVSSGLAKMRTGDREREALHGRQPEWFCPECGARYWENAYCPRNGKQLLARK